MKTLKPLMLMALGCLSLAAGAQTKSNFHVIRQFSIPSQGGWDYITVDGAAKKIYTSHGSQVNILNTNGDSIGYIPNTKGVHGIALAHAFNKGYTSNGRDNSCTIFDLKTNQVLGTVAVGTNPDAIFYDDFSKKVLTMNGRSADATVIDPATDKVIATIPLGGKPETAVSDGKGAIFINIETTNEEVVVDARSFTVIHRYKIEGGDEPSGLAIDRKTNRLFIGCGGNKTMVIMSTTDGKNLAKFPIGGCDGVAFDPELKQAYASNGEGTISIIKEINANKFEFIENIPTEPSARTIGIDVLTHKLYLPAAKTQAVAATAENAHPRPKIIPGSFHIIEVGQ